ncbi:glycosyl transferase [Aureococcus anophagefferens]|nr:glycosyl transferase [Aureococcus anophagefferens]
MRVGKTLTEEELEDHVLYEADPVKVGELSAWRKRLKAVIECWLVYSFGKYVVTGTCGFRGLRLLRGNDAKPATHWREEADAYVAAQRDAGDAGAELRNGTRPRGGRAAAGEFGGCFRALYCTLHELKPGEVAGKSSNENWAVRCAKRRLCDELGARSDSVVVTVCDADPHFHARYFAALSCAYVKRDALARRRTFWQACTQFYPNCDDVPLVCGVRYALLSVGFLGQMANPLHYKLPFAVYSVALDLAVEARYWDPAVIPEDWHMFLRCFYATAGEIRRAALLPVGCECVTDRTGPRTVAACYQQAKRWQWGAIDLGFIAARTGDAPPHRQLAVSLAATEHHLLYPLMWIVLAAAPWLVKDWATGWRFKLWAGFFVVNFFMLNVLDHAYRDVLARTLAAVAQRWARGLPRRARRGLRLLPFADLLLFVLPSLHAARRRWRCRRRLRVAPRSPSAVVRPLELPSSPTCRCRTPLTKHGVSLRPTRLCATSSSRPPPKLNLSQLKKGRSKAR